MHAEADAEANGVGRRHGDDRNGNPADEEHGKGLQLLWLGAHVLLRRPEWERLPVSV